MAKEKTRTKKWAVVHLIHVHTPHRHIPKLFIEDVPAEKNADDVKDWCEEMGYLFGEFGIPWATHYIEPLADCPPSVRGAHRRGDVETVAYTEPEPL